MAREPDVIDVVSDGSPQCELWSTWLDDDKVTIAQSRITYTSSNHAPYRFKQLTLSRRSGRMRVFFTHRRLWETATPSIAWNNCSRLPDPVRLLVSGHLYDWFMDADMFASRVQRDVWPMIMPSQRKCMTPLPAAYRYDNVHDFTARLLGYTHYDLELAIEQALLDDNTDAIYALQSMPMPVTASHYNDLIDVVRNPPKWRVPTRILSKLPFEHALCVVQAGMPDSITIGELDSLPVHDCSSLLEADNIMSQRKLTGARISPIISVASVAVV